MTASTTIITGGAGGIGSATARRLLTASDERHVALVDRTTSVLPHDLRDFEPRVRLFEGDVTDADGVAVIAERIRDDMPPADTLVNGAGTVRNDDSIDIPLTAFRELMAVHVDGTLLWCQHLASMLDGRPGAIVNIGSIAGQFGHPRRIAYAAAKAAVHSMTKTLAVEWAGRGIRVNAVSPGYIETPMMQEVARIGLVDTSVAASLAAMKRLGKKEEVAAGIAFLLGDEAGFITGHVLNIDGGFAVLKAE
ncbi:SDR family NAD(P)-dependent oxidoreductase [Herbiconiux sp. UC225_62]|uniref:SDR family NAD(P)-dependent oxidoreductase n=1 Tax=Herbiconiux sp. UC225_62 TaxID=3350168 RepID=UPI0036D3D749